MIAITRAVPPSMNRCELTHLDRTPIDVALAAAQHEAYEAALRSFGWTVEHLPPLPDSPDSVFVEDTAVVLDEIAIITRPGAESRRDEVDTAAAALAKHRPLARIEAPGTIDGGDVLVIGKTVYIGRSSRTNDAAIAQFERSIAPHGYRVKAIDVGGVLHLKSAVTQVGEGIIVINRAWIDFNDFEAIEVDEAEPFAANALYLGSNRVLFPEQFPRTREKLERRGIEVFAVDASEVAKAEGALTCCSLVVR